MATISGTERDVPNLSAEEKALLHACEIGNIEDAQNIIKNHGHNINVNCADIMGRTPLALALERDDIELIEQLLPYCNMNTVEDTLLDAINEKKESIACVILRHRETMVADELLTSGGESLYLLSSKFHPDTSPLILAAQRNLYEVVRELLLRGERIEHPHAYRCVCQECITQYKTDQLRYAHRRLNAYKGLASESYLSLQSEDPMLEAFELAQVMKEIPKMEKHFKADYLNLAGQLSNYLVKLLDRVRDQSELETVLNRPDNDEDDSTDQEPIGRIKMAVHHEEKKFVAHPSCQMKLVQLWYSGAGFLEKGAMLQRLLFCLGLVSVYPILGLLYIIVPRYKLVAFLRAPVIKFVAQTFSYLAFLTIVVSWTFNFDPGSSIHFHNEAMAKRFFRSAGKSVFLVRHIEIEPEELLIACWVLGFLWQECKQMYSTGFMDHWNSLYNVLDFLMIMLYLITLGLKSVSITKANAALEYFKSSSAFYSLERREGTALLHYYWLNPDRFYWNSIDPYHVAEGVFAIANVLTFSRISYLLPVNELFGPLQISLGRMIYDIKRFTGIFAVVFIAFLVGLENLFWYYSSDTRSRVELQVHSSRAVEAGENFGNIERTFRSVFWGIFGMTPSTSVDVDPYGAEFTRSIGLLLFGAYEVAIAVVLLNMLIAMMSSSFEQIEQDSDVEWKFARSKLYLEFIDSGDTLPPPLNLLPSPKAIWRVFTEISDFLHRCCGRKGTQNGRIPLDSNGSLDSSDDKNLKGKTHYKVVISRIVERFIYDVTTGGEENKEEDIDSMRQELLKLRRDVINTLTVHETRLLECRNDIGNLATSFSTMKSEMDEAMTEHQNKLADYKDDLVKLTKATDILSRSQEESLHLYLSLTEKTQFSLNVLSDHLLEGGRPQNRTSEDSHNRIVRSLSSALSGREPDL